jgi:DNA-binding FrmR family transcriptional regulator
MSRTTREKTKLINRVRRIRGQMEATERALEDAKGCAQVLQLIAGVPREMVIWANSGRLRIRLRHRAAKAGSPYRHPYPGRSCRAGCRRGRWSGDLSRSST